MTDHLGLRLTESDLDRLIAWRMAQIDAEGACQVVNAEKPRTLEQRAADFRRLLSICLLPFVLAAACALVALALA